MRLFSVAVWVFMTSLRPALASAETTAPYEARLVQIESQSKELCERIEALKKSSAGEAPEFQGRLSALEAEVKAIKAVHELTNKKLAALAKLGREVKEIGNQLAERLKAVEETVSEHGDRLDSHDALLKAQGQQLDRFGSVLRRNVFILEAIGFGGSKDGTGLGGAAGLSIGLNSGRALLIRVGAASSTSGSFTGLTTTTLQFPVDEELQFGVGVYTLGSFARASNKGWDTNRLGIGVILGPTFNRGLFTAGMAIGYGYSVQIGDSHEEGTAFLGLASMGFRL